MTEPEKTLPSANPLTRSSLDSFYSDRSIFPISFAPVTTGKLKLAIYKTTIGGAVNAAFDAAGGQTTGFPQATLREIEIYNSNGTPPPTTSTSLKARFYPRDGYYASAMNGGQFQGSNDGTNYSTLATLATSPNEDAWSEVSLGSTPYRYLRYLSPRGYTVLAELEFYNGAAKLSGTTFGTAGSYNNQGNTFVKAFDGDTSTFFDSPTSAPAFVGIDTATAGLYARFYPRVNDAQYMVGGKFQGSNDNNTWTDLATITTSPTDNAWNVMPLGATTYRSYRYLTGATYTVLAELEFYNGTTKLAGTPFGTAGSYNNYGNTYLKAFDGDITTYFDPPNSNGSFVGLDRGTN